MQKPAKEYNHERILKSMQKYSTKIGQVCKIRQFLAIVVKLMHVYEILQICAHKKNKKKILLNVYKKAHKVTHKSEEKLLCQGLGKLDL